jgi:antitoxin component of RelBE/YafQ-DinJ toxin-antitoxin module
MKMARINIRIDDALKADADNPLGDKQRNADEPV